MCLRQKKMNPILSQLWALTIVGILMDVLTMSFRSPINLFGNSYRLLEFLFLLRIYFFAFGERYTRSFIVVGIVYSAFFFVDLIFFQAGQLTSFSITLTAATFIVFSIFHFFKLMRDLPSTHIHQLPMFWIDTAVLVYFAGAFFIFLLRNYLIEVMNDDQIVYWSLHNILNIIKNILFAVGLWQATKSPVVKSETR